MTESGDVFELLRKIRYDATAIQAKVTDAMRVLTDMNLPEPVAAVCPQCGLRCRGKVTLAEHLYVSHDGPLPEVYRRIDNLVEETKL